MYEGYIYKIINDINDKIYIGQTKRDLETRFYQHLSKTRHKEDHSILHKAIEKYGKDYTKGMQIPFRYLHPVTLQWMIQVICQGRADSQIAALEQVKADLKQVNSQVQVSQEEYDEIM